MEKLKRKSTFVKRAGALLLSIALSFSIVGLFNSPVIAYGYDECDCCDDCWDDCWDDDCWDCDECCDDCCKDFIPRNFTIGNTVIGFSGYEWWVVGNGEVQSSGTSVPANLGNKITLWSKNNNFGTSNFYTSLTYGYANQYSGSTLKSTMEGLISKKQLLFTETREAALVNNRTLPGEVTVCNDGRTYTTGTYTGKVWALSKNEWNTINNSSVRSYGAYYWLRSPNPSTYNQVYVGATNGSSAYQYYPVNHNYVVRPAFNLEMPTVLFTSAASGDNKKSTTKGSMKATKSTGAIKLTAEDNKNLSRIQLTDSSLIEIGITTSPGSTVRFKYSGATVGENKYVSAVIYDTSSKEVMAHGVVGTTASGTAKFTMPSKSDLPIGNYELWVYNEEINGDNYTDYASKPIKIPLVVLDDCEDC